MYGPFCILLYYLRNQPNVCPIRLIWRISAYRIALCTFCYYSHSITHIQRYQGVVVFFKVHYQAPISTALSTLKEWCVLLQESWMMIYVFRVLDYMRISSDSNFPAFQSNYFIEVAILLLPRKEFGVHSRRIALRSKTRKACLCWMRLVCMGLMGNVGIHIAPWSLSEM